jgi:hypothetical protein
MRDAYDNALCESFFASLECELSTAGASPPRSTPAWPSSSTSKGGTTPIATLPSTTNPQSAMRRSTDWRPDPQAHHRLRNRGNSIQPLGGAGNDQAAKAPNRDSSRRSRA